MKKYLIAVIIGAGLLIAPVLRAERDEENEHHNQGKPPVPPEMMQKMMVHQKEMELRGQELELEKQQSELEFHRNMRSLELEKGKMELKKAGDARPPQGFGPGHPQFGPQPPPCGKVCLAIAHKIKHMMGMMFIIGVIAHILLTVWVYQDIRKRNAGSGIWIVLTLLTGICGALLYALVRIGDSKA